jgi:hypothetical protein
MKLLILIFRAVYCSLDAVELVTLIGICMLSTVSENITTLLKTYVLISMWRFPTHRVTAPHTVDVSCNYQVRHPRCLENAEIYYIYITHLYTTLYFIRLY